MTPFSFELSINEKLFLQNPQRTDLGRKILKNGVLLLDEVGFERFNFKKLANRINSAEASIYRYFENKHYLLVYLLNWYWEWMKLSIDLKTINIREPREKLALAIRCVVHTARRDARVKFIDEEVLHRIVVREGTKAYHKKEVDEQNKDGFFISYKTLCEQLAAILLEIRPDFPYPRALASNLLEMANNHIYFAGHLPRLTEIDGSKDILQQTEDLLLFFAGTLLNLQEIIPEVKQQPTLRSSIFRSIENQQKGLSPQTKNKEALPSGDGKADR